jgi:hypothetical protein
MAKDKISAVILPPHMRVMAKGLLAAASCQLAKAAPTTNKRRRSVFPMVPGFVIARLEVSSVIRSTAFLLKAGFEVSTISYSIS